MEHHRAGRAGPAEAYYRRSLKVDPRCAQALHLLGLLAQQAGQYQEAIRLIGEALSLMPDDPESLNSLAKAYLMQGQIPLAIHCYQRLAEALPRSALVFHRLGTAQEWQGDWDAAASSYRRALALQPGSPDIYGSLARVQCKLGATGDAVESCRCALALDPDRGEIHGLLGQVLINGGDYAAAVEVYRRALACKPDSAYAVFGLGYLFERQGDIVAAKQSYAEALKLDPRFADAQLHLGITNFLQADWAAAERCFQKVRDLAPDNAEARTFLAHLHLLHGDFALGWNEYENRWNTPHFLRNRRKLSAPLWKGEPLEGSRILLHAEQGLGDTLQFVRYVPLVAARGGSVVLEVPQSLFHLLATTEGAGEVIRRGEPIPHVDWQCPLMSLPRAFATELDSIPAMIPYLHPDPSLVEIWRQRFRGNSLRIGLVWGGSPAFPHERWRSIPLDQLEPLTNCAHAVFYSLQVGPLAGQVKQVGEQAKLIDLQSELKDFAVTAAIIANLDLIISIDTAVAHLAGALGKPVWILLHVSADWRWLLDRRDSPWYPTARLFRQSTLGDWRDVVTCVARELEELLATNGSKTRNGGSSEHI